MLSFSKFSLVTICFVYANNLQQFSYIHFFCYNPI